MMDASNKSLDSDVDSQSTMTPLCSVCGKVQSRYTCPRCNVRYCSVDCYRSESHADCSELFYRDCFTDALKGMETDSESKRRMMELLQRSARTAEEEGGMGDGQYLSDDDEDELAESINKLASIDLNADDVVIWNELPDAHKKTFVRMLKDGRLGQLVNAWQPWWSDDPAIIDLSTKHSRSSVPRILTGVSSINRLLSKSNPSETVRFAIVSAVYAYCYAARLYNGEHVSLAAESSFVITTLLSDPTVVASDVSSAIAGCLFSVGKIPNSDLVSREFSVAVIDDVRAIFSKGNIAAALSDCHAVMKQARRDALRETSSQREKRLETNVDDERSESDRVCENRAEASKDTSEIRTSKTKSNVSNRKLAQSQITNEHRTACFRIQKKLEFFISWTLEYKALLDALVPFLEIELCSLTSDLAEHASSKEIVEQIRAEKERMEGECKVVPKKLIEEIETDL